MLHSVTLQLLTHSVVSNSLRPHGLQHARHPSPSPTSRACLNSCPLTRWCHPTISSSVFPFSSSSNLAQHQSLFQWVRFFPVSWLFSWGGQSIGASASVLPMNIQVSFRIDWFDLLAVQGTLKSNNKMFLFCIYMQICPTFMSLFASQLLAFLYEYFKS